MLPLRQSATRLPASLSIEFGKCVSNRLFNQENDHEKPCYVAAQYLFRSALVWPGRSCSYRRGRRFQGHAGAAGGAWEEQTHGPGWRAAGREGRRRADLGEIRVGRRQAFTLGLYGGKGAFRPA